MCACLLLTLRNILEDSLFAIKPNPTNAKMKQQYWIAIQYFSRSIDTDFIDIGHAPGSLTMSQYIIHLAALNRR